MAHAKIIAVGNQKGGCGKTTLTMQLAGAFGRRLEVAVVDADTQATATRWASSAPEGKTFPALITNLADTKGMIHREIEKLLPKYDLVLVDCPPAIESPATQSVFLVADLVVLPVIPSPPDLWAAIGIRDLVESVMPRNQELVARLVAVMVQTTRLSKEALKLIEDFRIPLFDHHIGMRTAYRQSAAYGTTVHELRDRKAIEEVEALAAEIAKSLGIPYKKFIPKIPNTKKH